VLTEPLWKWLGVCSLTLKWDLNFGGCGSVTSLFLSNTSTVGPAIDLLALMLREASRDRSTRRVIVEGQVGLRDSGIAVQPSVFLD